MHPKILVWINTYNRLKQFSTLIEDINTQIKCDISILVYNDHSDEKDEYESIIKKYSNIAYTYADKNHGKHEYWKLYNMGLNEIRKNFNNFNYYFRLDDDLRLNGKECFQNIINIWEDIKDPKKITLMPLHDKRVNTHQWTDIQAEEIKTENYKVMKIGWIDDILFCDRRFFEVIDQIPTISKARWIKRPEISTGTGQYVTRILVKNYNMYGIHLDNCLITHEFDTSKNQSVMNREYNDIC